MLTFTVSDAGQTLLNNATAGTNPVLIDSVVLNGTNIPNTVSPVTFFAGSVVANGSDGGDYVVITFDDLDTSNAYTITSVVLKSGETTLATSESISIAKVEGKTACFRVSCQFDGANKCAFQNTNVNLPYATQKRDGIIRLARSTGETHKERTVYSASDVETLIAAGVSGSDKYVPWDTSNDEPVTGETTVSQIKIQTAYGTSTNEATITNSGGKLSINKTLTGDVVASSASFTSHAITNASTSEKVVNEKYIDSIYSNTVMVSSAATDKLVSGYAVNEFINGTGNNFVHKTGDESIAGDKIFTDDIIANGTISGTATVQSYATSGNDAWESVAGTRIPTVAAVKGAIAAGDDAVRSDLQSQIDGINAGQNLADIVNTKTALAAHALTDLKAKGDYKHGSSGDVWAVGDKIQVLHDTTVMSGNNEGQYDDSTPEKIAAGIATVYELNKGTKSASDKKDIDAATTGYFWHYVGEYGCDSYSKSEADGRYILVSNLDSTWPNSPASTHVPSSSAVESYVSSAVSTAGGNYVKLTSQTAQTITSDLDITGDVDITGQLDVDNLNLDGSTIVSYNTGCGGQAYQLSITNSGYSAVLDYMLTDDNNASGVGSLGTVASLEFHSDLPAGPAHVDLNVRDYDITFTSEGTGANKKPVVSGDYVADYVAAGLNSVTDGRLVTVDYLTEFTGDMSEYVKKTSQTAQTITSDLDITGDVDITGSLDVDNITLDGSTINASYVNTSGNPHGYKIKSEVSDGSVTFSQYSGSGSSTTNLTMVTFDGVSSIPSISVGIKGTTNHWLGLYVDTGGNSDVCYASGDFVADYTAAGLNSTTDGRLTTVDYVGSLIGSSTNSLHSAASDGTSQVGAIGLFMYTEVGAEKAIGSTVSGQYLYPVGMTLPSSGQISYKKSTTAMASGTTWTLMSLAMKRTATEPCLVLAMRTA